MFIDKVTIYCKAGNGGKGASSFRREKYVPDGGPDGGDGGKGGDIYFVADQSQNTLISFRYEKHYRADNGDKGDLNNRVGKCGKDVIIRVPRGTVIKDYATGNIVADIFNYDEKVLVLKGGKGGRGNARFATALRRSPNFAETGELTEEVNIVLELKTIADVGLVGFPNVGKSTILSVVSSAKPKIANYPFTTLSPNLGVVSHYDDSFVVADIPGLIEGASDGAGLGHSFLRHIERVRLIVHVIDVSGSEGRDPVEDYKIIRKELKGYSKYLSNLPEIVVANKCDMVYDVEVLKKLRAKCRCKVIEMSALTTFGVNELKTAIVAKLKDLPPLAPIEFDPFVYESKDKNHFEIKVESGVYYVVGGYIDDLARKVVFNEPESFRWFQKMLREKGIISALRKAGAKEGDTVCILDCEFDFVE